MDKIWTLQDIHLAFRRTAVNSSTRRHDSASRHEVWITNEWLELRKCEPYFRLVISPVTWSSRHQAVAKFDYVSCYE